ncbi:MAG: iron-sulfur cluster assembly scaffold protein [Xanthomonadales bacterium]|nr:iron-sulfur cluster assembly scaffold protein [Xanthomonadales bacterium]
MSSKPGDKTASSTVDHNRQTTVSDEDIALANLYRDAVIEHAVEPVGYKQDIAATHRFELYNPLCGDKVEMQFQVVEGVIAAAAFDGEACAICMASASMLCEASAKKTPGEIQQQHDLLVLALKDKQSTPGLASLQALLAVRRYPARIRCALLPWEAAVKALAAEFDS